MRSDMYRFSNPWELTDNELRWCRDAVIGYLKRLSHRPPEITAIARYELRQLGDEMRERA